MSKFFERVVTQKGQCSGSLSHLSSASCFPSPWSFVTLMRVVDSHSQGFLLRKIISESLYFRLLFCPKRVSDSMVSSDLFKIVTSPTAFAVLDRPYFEEPLLTGIVFQMSIT